MRLIRSAFYAIAFLFLGIMSATQVRADLLAYYPFEGNTNDVSGRNQHGTAYGSAAPGGLFSGVDGFNEAYSFGVDSKVVIPIDINPDVMPQLTVGMWVKSDTTQAATPGLYKTFGHDDGGWDRTFGLDARDFCCDIIPGSYRWAAFDGGVAGAPTATTGTPVTDQWTFLAAVWDADTATVRFHADGNSISLPATPTNGFGLASIGSLRPDNFAENFVGLIDDVFVFNEALDASLVNAIYENGPAVVQAFLPAAVERTLQFQFDFEGDAANSGSIGGWTAVNTSFGDNLAFADQPSDSTRQAQISNTKQGTNFIGTYEEPGNLGTDLSTGILESASWVLAENTQIEFLIGGGRLPFSGTPGEPASNVASFNVERLIGPDTWEVIATTHGYSTGGDISESLLNKSFDLRDWAGETVRMRVYDTATGGWGHINVDDIRVYSVVPEPASIGLFVGCLVALLGWRRSRR
ncbi:MAG: LamG domain-containing protein [Planctomycetales bacterium]|nr:LamG domain-containing protein [Planctomycetales bacterium]